MTLAFIFSMGRLMTFYEEDSGGITATTYVTEDGAQAYVTENGLSSYVTEA